MAESTFNNLLSLLYIQELKEQYIEGGPTEVAITEVDVLHRRFVCSEALAVEHRTLRGIKCVLFSLLYSTLLYSTLLYSTLLDSTRLSALRPFPSLCICFSAVVPPRTGQSRQMHRLRHWLLRFILDYLSSYGLQAPSAGVGHGAVRGLD